MTADPGEPYDPNPSWSYGSPSGVGPPQYVQYGGNPNDQAYHGYPGYQGYQGYPPYPGYQPYPPPPIHNAYSHAATGWRQSRPPEVLTAFVASLLSVAMMLFALMSLAIAWALTHPDLDQSGTNHLGALTWLDLLTAALLVYGSSAVLLHHRHGRWPLSVGAVLYFAQGVGWLVHLDNAQTLAGSWLLGPLLYTVPPMLAWALVWLPSTTHWLQKPSAGRSDRPQS